MRDKATIRLSWLCVLAGLHPLAWWHMTATEFQRAIARRAWS